MRRYMALRWHSKTFSRLFQAMVFFCIDFHSDWILSVYRWMVGSQHVRLPTTTKYGWKTETLFSLQFQIVHETFLHFMLSNLHILCGQQSRSDQSRPAGHAFVFYEHFCFRPLTIVSLLFSVVLSVFFEKFDFDRWMCQVLCQERTHTHTH